MINPIMKNQFSVKKYTDSHIKKMFVIKTQFLHLAITFINACF